jgi:hypothetical protein
MNGYTPLGNDILNILAGYGENPRISNPQREHWCAEDVVPEALGCDHHKALRLLKEDGGDGLTVGSLRREDAARVSDYGLRHAFPPARDLVRLAAFLRLDLYRALNLVLKGEWELVQAERSGWRPNNGMPLEAVLHSAAGSIPHVVNDNFNPDTHVLFCLFEEHGAAATQAGYDPESFDTLVQEMIMAEMHVVANRSPELRHFSERSARTVEAMNQATAEQKQEFWLLKCQWLEQNQSLGELLLVLEKRRLANANVRQRWLAAFGKEWFGLEQQAGRVEDLSRRLAFKRMHPELSLEGLDAAMAEDEATRAAELERLEFEISLGLPDHTADVGGAVLSEKEVAEYVRRSKKLLRELFFLVHPDGLRRQPAFGKLTEKQQDRLKGLWQRVMVIRHNELNWPARFLAHDMRPLFVLEQMLAEAKAVLDMAGLETEVSTVIQGDTLAEQTDWLKRAICQIEDGQEIARGELKTLMEDRDVLEQQAMLACPEQKQADLKQQMLRKTEEYREQADKLGGELAALFAGEGKNTQ